MIQDYYIYDDCYGGYTATNIDNFIQPEGIVKVTFTGEYLYPGSMEEFENFIGDRVLEAFENNQKEITI